MQIVNEEVAFECSDKSFWEEGDSEKNNLVQIIWLEGCSISYIWIEYMGSGLVPKCNIFIGAILSCVNYCS